MGYVDVQQMSCVLPDGRVLFDDLSFRVGDGSTTALVGANGTGKTTLLRMRAGDVPWSGAVARSGGVGVMRQFIGSIRDETTVRHLLVALSPPAALDEPTDNLDLDSAEALEEGLRGFEGTVVAVTHDRSFARGFDRYLVFGQDGRAYEAPEPVWDEGRVQPARGDSVVRAR